MLMLSRASQLRLWGECRTSAEKNAPRVGMVMGCVGGVLQTYSRINCTYVRSISQAVDVIFAICQRARANCGGRADTGDQSLASLFPHHLPVGLQGTLWSPSTSAERLSDHHFPRLSRQRSQRDDGPPVGRSANIKPCSRPKRDEIGDGWRARG